MNAGEIPISFLSKGAVIRGVLHRPAGSNGVGVVLLHGWSGNRLGPHRLFVLQARRLAALGYHALRFDFRGRGESEGETFSVSIETMVEDAQAAQTAFRAATDVKRLYFLGICSGCKVAIGAAVRCSGIAGLALWSAEPMGPLRVPSQRVWKSWHALRQYARKLMVGETWQKIWTGRIQTRFVKKALVAHERPAAEEIRRETEWLKAFRSFRGRLLFLYGGNDPDTRVAAQGYAAFCMQHQLPFHMHEIPEANHSFYSLCWSEEIMARTERWLEADPAVSSRGAL